ncbi:hypothetical protein [Dyella sp.]|uniref:hypothetical protein n=1 Tax=Dyella sp. TaxID=1869338 RepID=UPI002D76AFE8|nr:hypothetical protein [Dyella sp.]HET7332803.1 hypothetical protein [Dyella sp.]
MEQINQDERILQIGLGKKGKSVCLIGFFLHENAACISLDSDVTGQAVLSTRKKENQFSICMACIEAVITHPITYKKGFCTFYTHPGVTFSSGNRP